MPVPTCSTDRVCVVTPTARTRPDRSRRVHAFWSSLGCRVAGNVTFRA